MTAKAPLTLIILDGWGIAPNGEGNAVTIAKTPFMDSLFAAYPSTSLDCFGEAVGLPEGQMGNSEVGHLNLGAGRVVYQDITRINLAIRENTLAQNPAIKNCLDQVESKSSTLHLIGLVSPGGVHSLMTHLYALIDLAHERNIETIAIHALLDGRDTPPDSGAGYLAELQDHLSDTPKAFIASVGGRFWGMDRDKRWKRVHKAYEAMVHGQGAKAADPVKYVRECYAREEFDEFVTPAVITDPEGAPRSLIKDNDGIIFFNFRADRARELTWAFNSKDFDGFDVTDRPRLADYVCMTQYDEHLEGIPVAFPPMEIKNTLAQVLSRQGKRQLHIAETEKYAHVTFFFNGGVEEPYPGEDRVLVPSPQEVETYDEKPQMSAFEVTEKVVEKIKSGIYDFIVMNYANGDMVGHTGSLPAAIKAMEALDYCLKEVIPAVLAQGGRVLLTADHGNAEQMIDPKTGGPYTAHTAANPVPFLLIDPDLAEKELNKGALCDVAPTALALLGLEQPKEMTGRPLINPVKE
jgi:2,3-bisphosphoglycerate-independent phosphoglycerate mutase